MHKENLKMMGQSLSFIPTHEECPIKKWLALHDKKPLGVASGDFAIKNDNGDYRDRADNSMKVHSVVLHTMKYEFWERSSNTNSYLMVVELEALFASQVRIMKYELMDKFLSIELEENIFLKSHLVTM
jgi:hypothetical protein